MRKFFPVFFLLGILAFAGPVGAGYAMAPAVAEMLAEAKTKQLSRHPVWLKLLGYKGDSATGYKSSIVSREFFIADNGNTDPQVELEASLKSFFEVVDTANNNVHPQCRFPARLYWLRSMLDVPENLLPEVRCERLEDWADFENLNSVSLIMVSGYFGNPASTFGHNLIKLNNGNSDGAGNLLDLGITYGAAVPQNEATFIYIVRGLFGGYEGGFSDKTFYTQDTLYSEIQFRDMWEYELALTEFQKNLMVYHLWELMEKKYTYYFLKENCGYRVAELLELVTGEDLIRERQPWFLPIDVFHGLNEIKDKNGASLIREIKFIPSSQRLLYRDFENLGSEQARAVNSSIAEDKIFDSAIFEGFSIDDRMNMSDFLLSYYQYRLAEFEDDAPEQLKSNKDAVLRYRLTLPVAKGVSETMEVLAPPASGSRATLTVLGTGYQEDFGVSARFGFAAVDYDILSIQGGGLENSELKIADLRFSVSRSSSIYLDYFDLVSIQKINTRKTSLHGESNRSWRVSAGLQRRDLTCIDCQTLYLEGGVGKALVISDSLTGYGMLDVGTQLAPERIRVTPFLGLIFNAGIPFKAVVEVGSRVDHHNKNGDTVIRLDSRYALSKKYQIRFGFDHYRASEYRLGLFHYW